MAHPTFAGDFHTHDFSVELDGPIEVPNPDSGVEEFHHETTIARTFLSRARRPFGLESLDAWNSPTGPEVGCDHKSPTHREEKRDHGEQSQGGQVVTESQESRDEQAKPRKDEQASKDDAPTPRRIKVSMRTHSDGEVPFKDILVVQSSIASRCVQVKDNPPGNQP